MLTNKYLHIMALPAFSQKQFWAGVAKSFILNRLPYQKSPFLPAEKAWASDWEKIGGDIQSAVKKFNTYNERT